MPFPKSIGAIELSSLGLGYRIEDDMLKAASVELLIARTICSGKYFIVVGGSVSDVEASIQAGLDGAGEAIIDHLVLPNVHPTVFPALGQSIALGAGRDRRLGGDRDLQRRERAGGGRRRRQGRPHHAVPHPRGDGPGRQGALPDDRPGGRRSRRRAGGRDGGPPAAACWSPEIVIPRPSRELFGDYL